MAAIVLVVLSWVAHGAIALFCFLCLAAGLNTLAEVADERPKSTQYVLKGMARFGIALNAFIGASTSIGNLVGFVGVVAHIMYLLLAPSFPALDILSTKAVGGLLLLAAHNFAAFRQFAREEYPHDEVLAYHVLCIWMVPFIIFITCSADNFSLPTSTTGAYSTASTGEGGSGRGAAAAAAAAVGGSGSGGGGGYNTGMDKKVPKGSLLGALNHIKVQIGLDGGRTQKII